MRTVSLLGPQRLAPTLVDVVNRLGISGTIAAVTAGWQEREDEDDEMRAHLERPVINLRLHRRLENVFDEDRELFHAHRARQDKLRALQRLYRFRLDHALEPARRLLRRADPTERMPRELLEAERQDAIVAVRRLDARHLERIRQIHRAFEEETRPLRRPAIARQCEEIKQLLDDADAVAVAGGHVAVLLNRLRLFGGRTLFPDDLPVVCWSAGAMALAERVVLFHDAPPQGAGNAEVLDVGLGLFPGLVALPHAEERMRLQDEARVELFARRFAPAKPVVLDPGVELHWDGSGWSGKGKKLGTDGRLEPFAEERAA